MKISDQNTRVRLRYSMSLDGEVIETTGDDPIEFITGREEIIPILEKKLLGLEPGSRSAFDARPDEAFGPRDAEAIRVVSRGELHARGAGLEPGTILRVRDDDGNNLVVTIVAADNDTVSFDLNHPLAGRVVHFDIEIVAADPL